MNKLLFLLLSTVLCTACGKKYSIEGLSSLSRLDGKKMYIKVPRGNEMVSIDSAEVIHGAFRMQGRVDSVVIASLYVGNDCILPVVIESGKIQINIDNAGMTVKGTPLNNCFNEFMMKKNALDDMAYEVERLESRMIMDGKSPGEIQAEVERQRSELGAEVDKLAKTFIQDNYDNVLGPGVFLMFCNGLPYPMMTPVMGEIVNDAPETVTNHPPIQGFVSVARSNMSRIQEAQSRSAVN